VDTCWAETSFFAGSTVIVAPDLKVSMNNKSGTYLADMRARLLELREQLESVAAVSDDSSQTVELDQARVGRLSRMDALQAQAMSQATGRRREMMLRKISAALERIDNDDYGRCQSCEEMIGRGRLDSDPTAVLCIECATRAEQQ
jgi:DnaK suppressor protein